LLSGEKTSSLGPITCLAIPKDAFNSGFRVLPGSHPSHHSNYLEASMHTLRWFACLSFLAIGLFPIGLNLPPAQTSTGEPPLPITDHYNRRAEKDIRLDPTMVPPAPDTPRGDLQSNEWRDTGVAKWSKVVYQRWFKNWEIMLINGDGTGLGRLTDHTSNEIYPEFNHGTTKIAYLSDQDGPDYDIWVMNSDGTRQIDLTKNKADEDPATWSPDGNWLAFASNRDGNWEIYRMHPDGTQVTRLTYSSGADFSPTWSPDNSQIAWVHSEPGSNTGAIWTMSADGANAVQIVSGLPLLDHLHWSSDGKVLGFSYDSDQDGWLSQGILNLDGTKNIKTNYIIQNMDFIENGWAPDNSSDCSTELFYTLYEGSYYLTGTQIEGITVGGNWFNASKYDMNGTWTGMDVDTPTSQIDALPDYSRADGLPISWQGNDSGPSGLRGIDLQTRVNGGLWTDWQTDTADLSALFNGQAGQTVSFRSRARDYQYNQEAWPAEGFSPSTHLFTSLLHTDFFDSHGQHVPNASLSISANSWEQPNPGAAGQIDLHLNSSDALTLAASHAGYPNAPQVSLNANQDQRYSLYFPPTQNILQNGGFENALGSWTVQGTSPWTVSPSIFHSGTGSAQVGPDLLNPNFGPAEDYPYTGSNRSSAIRIDSKGNIHTLSTFHDNSTQTQLLIYQMRSPDGVWTDPQILGQNIGKTYLEIGADDTLYTINNNVVSISFSMKPSGGKWSAPKQIASNLGDATMAVSSDGIVQVVYWDTSTEYFRVIRRNPSGTWSKPIDTAMIYGTSGFSLIDTPDGNAELFWTNNSQGTMMQIIHPDGTTEQPRLLFDVGAPALVKSPNGKISMFLIGCRPSQCGSSYYSYHTYFSILGDAGTWSQPIDLGPIYQISAITVGPKGEIYLSGSQSDGGNAFHSIMLYRSPEGTWLGPEPTKYSASALAVDQTGRVMMITDIINQYNLVAGQAFMRVQDAQQDDTSLTQSVTIPADMHRPTLSFLYLMNEELFNSTSTLQASVDGDCTVQPFSAAGNSEGWQHSYVDLTGCEGKTVTVHLGLHQAGGEPAATLLVDEVSLGPWLSPRITSISPAKLIFSNTAPWILTLNGENFNHPTVSIGRTSFNAVVVDSNTLTVDLSGWVPTPGRYDVIVTNADGTAAALPAGFQIGDTVMLPFIRR
jgi:hypothetical protein